MGSHNACLSHDNPIALASNAALSGVEEALLKMRIEKNEAPRRRSFRVLINRYSQAGEEEPFQVWLSCV
ncbi:hypothetical protein IAS59_001301 [Cryptococcus gattii]